MTSADPLAAGLVGALRALGWAFRFYLSHPWPLLVLAVVPLVVRVAMSFRVRQMLGAGSGEATEAVVAVWRGVLMLAIAGLDLLPDSPWWESIWPGAWTAQLSGRLGAMAGRGAEWTVLCFGVAMVITIFVAFTRLTTTPRVLVRVLLLLGMTPRTAVKRAEVIGVTVTNLITIPITTLLMYAAVARAALSLRA